MSRRSDRARWTPMLRSTRNVPQQILDQAKTDAGVAQWLERGEEVWANNLYTATVFRDPKGRVNTIGYHRHDRSAVRDWRHEQHIKTDIAGAEAEAIQLYPKESRLVDNANEYWLFVVVQPDEPALPVGFNEGRQVNDLPADTNTGARQRPIEQEAG